ncbi:MAG TPA: ATP-binding cassette domain-containing protein, partial [Anaerovoracaceae bacterium]|nr:ATP-binding cassette domain-containing protein [Anaerovoracaceae bacterium]
MIIEIKDLNKSYDGHSKVLNGVDLKVEKGELVTILGPSGCGKTTLLKTINKLIERDEGDIYIKGKNISDWDTIELRRSIGYVIQQIGLFPHMTIEDNITYVLALRSKDKVSRRRKAEELITLVGMDEEILDRYPIELSGGQKQRIGVARALAAEPDIILMDEPFGAVDEIARSILQDELLNLQTKLKTTIMFVTHDIQEALKLGDRIVLMSEGLIEQVGTKEELLFNPNSDFVKNFVGIKGFKSILDNDIIGDLYDRIIDKDLTIEELYERLNEEPP